MGKKEEGVDEGKGGKGCPPPIGILDPAVKEGREGRMARRGAWVGAFRHFFFPV